MRKMTKISRPKIERQTMVICRREVNVATYDDRDTALIELQKQPTHKVNQRYKVLAKPGSVHKLRIFPP